MKTTLGGESRIGSGNKLTVDLHKYGRSNHNLSHVFRTTMAAGTLVPFLCMPGLPGDTFDIELDANVMTHPTVGPVYGSYKLQADLYSIPVRLYQSWLNNDKLAIGLKMSDVKIPGMKFTAPNYTVAELEEIDIDNCQVNPSCILSYIGLRGIGIVMGGNGERWFNAMGLLSYWDIVKNYYADKQIGKGAVIHKVVTLPTATVTQVDIQGSIIPTSVSGFSIVPSNGGNFKVDTTALTEPSDIMLILNDGTSIALNQCCQVHYRDALEISGIWDTGLAGGNLTVVAWKYRDTAVISDEPEIVYFDLTEIDKMREAILQHNNATRFDVMAQNIEPYKFLGQGINNARCIQSTQEGLALKTYQSDLLNNWMRTDWIDGVNGINEITAVDVSSGKLSVDALVLQKHVYELLNRIAVSGGSYDDWIATVYTTGKAIRTTTPVYHGGLSKEVVFQEVVSTAVTETSPLGQLAGKGRLSEKHKGGKVTIKCEEPCYIMGIVSLTPRLCYSQGNQWDINLEHMDQLHKPGMDGIGFQELITEQMAWWSTVQDATNSWYQTSAGKQPAWINWMTEIDRARGNFAFENNEMFMILNRKYEKDLTLGIPQIKDLTTYIDPSKYNSVFAQTSLDAQNFWVQIKIDNYARRVMSAKVMPNL